MPLTTISSHPRWNSKPPTAREKRSLKKVSHTEQYANEITHKFINYFIFKLLLIYLNFILIKWCSTLNFILQFERCLFNSNYNPYKTLYVLIFHEQLFRQNLFNLIWKMFYYIFSFTREIMSFCTENYFTFINKQYIWHLRVSYLS